MLRVGLTGGIGAGKSTVARRLAALGAVVVDADALAREVVAPGTDGLAAVVAEFGEQVLAHDGSLDRPALGAVVFADPHRRRALEAITHPLVRRRRDELVALAPVDAVVVDDIPLLVETGRGAEWPLVVVVDTPADVRVRRLVDGRGMPEDAARSRVAAQSGDDERRAAADVLLDGSGTVEQLGPAVDRLWHERLVLFESNLRRGRRAPRPSAPLLVEPDPSWAQQADRLVARVRRVAADRATSVEHVGSTSVPGLVAKDTVDLQVVVPDLDVALAVAADLGTAGLVPGEGSWWDEPALRPGERSAKVMAFDADPGRRVNCHVRPVTNPEVEEVLLLRDRLRGEPALRERYAALKRDLVTRHDDIDGYAAAKTAFIAGVLRESGRGDR